MPGSLGLHLNCFPGVGKEVQLAKLSSVGVRCPMVLGSCGGSPGLTREVDGLSHGGSEGLDEGLASSKGNLDAQDNLEVAYGTFSEGQY
ncbi:hypothetical protein VNO78_03759 [Psophocarpus tetragonolobus]|uniref:Uncharacterized protein n=1 Tax=Psophocarpus tetragonolobus TaxID=3891 RepID=A0AAN9XW76_PSOTE